MGKDKFERKLFFACLLILATAGVYVLGYYTKVWTTPDTLVELEYILELIEENYIGEFDKDAFISSAVKGSLDKYSSYYTPVDYTEVTLSRDGVSQGKMGMGFLTTSNGVIVYSVEGNSPAERANIPVGGQILGIKRVDDAEFTAVSTYDEWNAFYTTLKKNEQVTVKILYGEEREYTLAREDYSISYVWYQDCTGAYNMTYEDKEWMLVKREIPLKSHINDGYAYIKLSTFSGKAYEQVKLALDKMKANGNTKLIFDLRSNGGGYMNILTDIAGCLAPGKDKQAISKAVYKNGKEDVFYSSKNYYNDSRPSKQRNGFSVRGAYRCNS